MEKDMRLLHAEILRTRSEVDTITSDTDAINDDIVLINADLQNFDGRITAAETYTAETAAAVSAIQSDVDDLERKNNEQNARITNLDALTGEHTANISSLQADTAAQGQRVGALETRADNTDMAIHTLDIDIERIDVDIYNVKADITGIHEKNNEQDARITNLDALTGVHTANISSLQADTAAQGQRVGALETRADNTDTAIHTLDIDIERIDVDISNANIRVDDLERKEDERAHYLGAFQATAALLAYSTPSPNDFADNYQTSTRWIYTGGAWSNTGVPIPTDATILGNAAPVMNGSASAGVLTTASRVDHVHPSDTSRVPTSRMINGKPLTGNIAFTAADVGAVPTTRLVNNKALSADIALTAADVGAVPTTRLVNNKALSADIALTAADVGAVPTTRLVNNKALSADIALNAADVGAVSFANQALTTAQKTQARTNIDAYQKPSTGIPKTDLAAAVQVTLDKADNAPTENELLNKIYPVGAIYISYSSTSPSLLFGGVWSVMRNRFLIGAGSNYTVGSTGGETTHLLTVEEMPSHNHGLLRPMQVYGVNGGSERDGWYEGDFMQQSVTDTGGNQSHNNMPPYIAVYMWHRTA